MAVTVEVSRQYREGNWSIYNETVTEWWDDFLYVLGEDFDSNNPNHVAHGTAFIQAKYGNDTKVRLMI